MSRKSDELTKAVLTGGAMGLMGSIFGGSSKPSLIEQMIPGLLDLIKYQKQEIKGRREDNEELQEKIEKLEEEIKVLKSKKRGRKCQK